MSLRVLIQAADQVSLHCCIKYVCFVTALFVKLKAVKYFLEVVITLE